MPGGSLAKGFGKMAQSAFGPHAVVGFEDVHMGHPQWGAKMAAIREANRRNEVAKRAPGRTTRAFQGLSDGGRDAAHDKQGHGGGGKLGSARDRGFGGPRKNGRAT